MKINCWKVFQCPSKMDMRISEYIDGHIICGLNQCEGQKEYSSCCHECKDVCNIDTVEETLIFIAKLEKWKNENANIV